MLLVSRESELKMFAELVSVDDAIDSEENTLSFALDKKFTDNHQINLVVEDKQRQHAIFVTESFYVNNNFNDNNLIDSVTLMKIVLGADDKLSYKQMTIVLPEQQVNA
jgi:hypothetical protein